MEDRLKKIEIEKEKERKTDTLNDELYTYVKDFSHLIKSKSPKYELPNINISNSFNFGSY